MAAGDGNYWRALGQRRLHGGERHRGDAFWQRRRRRSGRRPLHRHCKPGRRLLARAQRPCLMREPPAALEPGGSRPARMHWGLGNPEGGAGRGGGPHRVQRRVPVRRRLRTRRGSLAGWPASLPRRRAGWIGARGAGRHRWTGLLHFHGGQGRHPTGWPTPGQLRSTRRVLPPVLPPVGPQGTAEACRAARRLRGRHLRSSPGRCCRRCAQAHRYCCRRRRNQPEYCPWSREEGGGRPQQEEAGFALGRAGELAGRTGERRPRCPGHSRRASGQECPPRRPAAHQSGRQR